MRTMKLTAGDTYFVSQRNKKGSAFSVDHRWSNTYRPALIVFIIDSRKTEKDRSHKL